MGDGIGMEREGRWTGNTQCPLRVVPGDESPTLDGRASPEDLIITNLLSPTIMSHPPPSRDDDWVEPFDALQGTAVFDATGDKATMPAVGGIGASTRGSGILASLSPFRQPARR
uniref:U1756t n=1 Tax=Mycobacterium leprae TaxID=1769 RepID=Q49970_MYCLR|nr:u1756t [Mycobacterium leprae]